jgi:Ribbon-helix-helix protein, copG family
VSRRRATVTVRLPRELYEAVQAKADTLGTPAHWLLARLVREGLERTPDTLTLTEETGEANGPE